MRALLKNGGGFPLALLLIIYVVYLVTGWWEIIGLGIIFAVFFIYVYLIEIAIAIYEERKNERR